MVVMGDQLHNNGCVKTPNLFAISLCAKKRITTRCLNRNDFTGDNAIFNVHKLEPIKTHSEVISMNLVVSTRD